MITLVTNTTTVIELTAYPFADTVIRRGKQIPVLVVPCAPSLDLKNIQKMFSDKASMSVLSLVDKGAEVTKYNDYSQMEEISYITSTTDEETGATTGGYYVVKMSQKLTFEEDLLAVKRAIGDIKATEKEAAEAKAVQDKTIEELTEKMGTAETNITTIQDSMKEVDPETLDLYGLKDYLVKKSKENLTAFLASNPIMSSAHGGVMKSYSITAEKQSYLMAMILMTANMEEARLAQLKAYYEQAIADKEATSFEDFVAGVDNGTISTGQMTFNKYQPSWNAVGETCTYDWTLNELKMLAAEIEGRVRPLVSAQQKMEVEIKKATTKEAAKAVDLSFYNVPYSYNAGGTMTPGVAPEVAMSRA